MSGSCGICTKVEVPASVLADEMVAGYDALHSCSTSDGWERMFLGFLRVNYRWETQTRNICNICRTTDSCGTSTHD